MCYRLGDNEQAPRKSKRNRTKLNGKKKNRDSSSECKQNMQSCGFPASEGVVAPAACCPSITCACITTLLGQYESGKSTATIVLKDVKSVFSQR